MKSETEAAWFRDPVVEQVMAQVGMQWEIKENPISRIKMKESVLLNARATSVDMDAVERYAFAMLNGTKFPMPVLHNELIMGGMQRIHGAIKAGRTAIMSYNVTKATQQQLAEFIRRDNIRHGKVLTDDERIAACVLLHHENGTPLNKLNDTFFGGNGKMYQKLSNASRAGEVTAQLALQSVVGGSIPASSLTALHPIVKEAIVLREAALLTKEYGIGSDQVSALVQELKKQPTEALRLDMLKEHRATLKAKTEHGVRAIPPTAVLRKILTSVTKGLNSGNEGKSFPPIDVLFKKEEAREAKEAVDIVIHLLKKLKTKVR
jgi:hypothetical protein